MRLVSESNRKYKYGFGNDVHLERVKSEMRDEDYTWQHLREFAGPRRT